MYFTGDFPSGDIISVSDFSFLLRSCGLDAAYVLIGMNGELENMGTRCIILFGKIKPCESRLGKVKIDIMRGSF